MVHTRDEFLMTRLKMPLHQVPDDCGADSRTPRRIRPATSTLLAVEGRGLQHHDEAVRRWYRLVHLL